MSDYAASAAYWQTRMCQHANHERLTVNKGDSMPQTGSAPTATASSNTEVR